jgi:hypothetical protein
MFACAQATWLVARIAPTSSLHAVGFVSQVSAVAVEPVLDASVEVLPMLRELATQVKMVPRSFAVWPNQVGLSQAVAPLE